MGYIGTKVLEALSNKTIYSKRDIEKSKEYETYI